MSKRFIYYGSFASVQFFSDLFGMPAAAYSLRKLTPNATNCIRVRRSSDNTEQDIGFVANVPNSPIDTTALLAFVGAGNGFVTTWYDQSTNVRNGTQTSSAFQPRIVNAGVIDAENSNPCLLFDGSNDSLAIPPFNFSAENYNTFVGKRDASSRRLLGLAGTQYLLTLWNDNRYYLQGNTTGYQESTATDLTTSQLIITGLNNGTSQEIYKNSSIVSSNFVSFNLATGIENIGRYLSGSLYANCKLQEIVFYNADKSTDRTSIETNINTYYNVF